MFTKKLTLLILIFLFSSPSLVEIEAQNFNRIGIGLNIGNTWGFNENNEGQMSIGLKLYYEGKVSADFSVKVNTELLLPMELFLFPIETSVLYSKSIYEDTQYFIGIGTGYYWLENNTNRLYYYEKDAQVIYQAFEEGVIGVNGIAGINIMNISIELKYILLSVNQNETLYYHEPSYFTENRIKKINLNTLKINISYYFDF